MDPLQSKELEVIASINQSPAIIISRANEILIQLEGSHTTSTETENLLSPNKKNVKFEDKIETEEQNFRETEDEFEDGIETEEQNLRETEDEELTSLGSNGIIQKFVELKDESSEFFEIEGAYHVGKKEDQQQELEIGDFEEFQELKKLEEFKFKNAEEMASVMILKAENKPLANGGPSEFHPVDLVHQEEIHDISTENKEISQRFRNIIDMFNSFTKNLETLGLSSKSVTSQEAGLRSIKRKRPKSELLEGMHDFEEPHIHRRRYENDLRDDQRNEDSEVPSEVINLVLSSSLNTSTSCGDLLVRNHVEEYLKLQEMAIKSLEKASKQGYPEKYRTISTSTSSCELKTFGCQTLPPDHISLNDISLMDGSSLTSRSEQPNSLNNYAQPENACVSYNRSQEDVSKKPLSETITQQPLSSPLTMQQEPLTPSFNVITIEANSRPSSADLRRSPLCHRLWKAIGDFCAATFLCLQVNKDCIFCLGFFAAFVVSVSFLTAFFYHTLSMSPSLWQTTDDLRL